MAPPFGRADFPIRSHRRPPPPPAGDIRPEYGPPPGFNVADSLEDPQYRYFLEHLRVDGQCYVFETPPDSSVAFGRPSAVSYESAVDPPPHRPPPATRRARSGVKATPLKGKQRAFPSVLKGRIERPIADLDYQLFLSCVKLKGESMVFEGFDRQEIVYEEGEDEVVEIAAGEMMDCRVEEVEVFEVDDEKRGNVAEVVAVDKTEKEIEKGGREFDGCLNAVVVVVDEHIGDNSDNGSSEVGCYDFNEFLRGRGPSNFKNRLMSVLEKPFSQEEYDELMSVVNVRKPIVKYKHLRDESISYSTKMLGYSYLDHYPDIARMVGSADPFSRLSLLRGFFFWLENVGHEGSFMPWVKANVASDNCKAIVPFQMEE